MNTKLKPQAAPLDPQEEAIRSLYLESLHLVERLPPPSARRHQGRVRPQGRSDVNAIQALLLFNIGNAELTAGELRSRGYYLGSNVSYNVKKLVDLGFINHQRSRVDRRSVRNQPDGCRPGNRRNRCKALRTPHRLDPEGRRHRRRRVHPDEQAPAAPRPLLERPDPLPSLSLTRSTTSRQRSTALNRTLPREAAGFVVS